MNKIIEFGEIDFICPECGCEDLMRKELSYMYNRVCGVEQGNLDINLEDTHYEDGSYVGDDTGYVCLNCDTIIANEADDLIAWLNEHGMIGEEKYELAPEGL